MTGDMTKKDYQVVGRALRKKVELTRGSERTDILAQIRAARAYVHAHGPVPQDAINVHGEHRALRYDAVSLSCDTGSDWYAGLSNEAIERGLRVIHRTLAARRLT